MSNNTGFNDELWGLFTDEMKGTIDFIQNSLAYEHPALALNENYFYLVLVS